MDFLKTVSPKVLHVLVGVFVAYFFAVFHAPMTGLLVVTGLALGKEWGDYLKGEPRQSCLYDLTITVAGGALGILLHLI